MIWVSTTIVTPDKSLRKIRMHTHLHYAFRTKLQEVLNSLYIMGTYSAHCPDAQPVQDTTCFDLLY